MKPLPAAVVQVLSAFDAYLGDALDEVTLQDKKKYQRWQGHDGYGGHRFTIAALRGRPLNIQAACRLPCPQAASSTLS